MDATERDFVLERTLGGRAAEFWWRADELGNLVVRRTATPGQSHAAKGRLVRREELEALLAWMATRQWVLLECLPAKLRDGTAREGLGRFLCERLGWPPPEAPFASHLAAVLTAAEVLAWNGKRRSMAFRLVSADLGRVRACYERRRVEAAAAGQRRQPKRPPQRRRRVPGGQKPPQFDLGERFRALARELRATVESLSGGQHPADKGGRREGAVRALLRRVLPEPYAVACGEVVHCSLETSGQVDVLIYDRRAPVLLEADPSVVVPAESVLAAIEVKPLLRRGELAEALASLRQVKALRPMAIFQPQPPRPQQHPTEPNPPAFTAVFSLESVRPRRVLESLRELEADTVAALAIDCVCLVDRGVIFRTPGLLDAPQLPETLDPRRPAPLVCVEAGEESLLAFYVLLYEQLALRRFHLPDLRAYLGSFGLPQPISP